MFQNFIFKSGYFPLRVMKLQSYIILASVLANPAAVSKRNVETEIEEERGRALTRREYKKSTQPLQLVKRGKGKGKRGKYKYYRSHSHKRRHSKKRRRSNSASCSTSSPRKPRRRHGRKGKGKGRRCKGKSCSRSSSRSRCSGSRSCSSQWKRPPHRRLPRWKPKGPRRYPTWKPRSTSISPIVAIENPTPDQNPQKPTYHAPIYHYTPTSPKKPTYNSSSYNGESAGNGYQPAATPTDSTNLPSNTGVIVDDPSNQDWIPTNPPTSTGVLPTIATTSGVLETSSMAFLLAIAFVAC